MSDADSDTNISIFMCMDLGTWSPVDPHMVLHMDLDLSFNVDLSPGTLTWT